MKLIFPCGLAANNGSVLQASREMEASAEIMMEYIRFDKAILSTD